MVTHNRIKVYKVLDHFFQHSETGNPIEVAKIEETISPEVLADMAGWIKDL